MSKQAFFERLRLSANPFQYTNADKESALIQKYFIYPDYFEDVWGDPENPVSNIIYAPRGGGKTAQRVMIEKRAKKNDSMLTITYTDHDLSAFSDIAQVSLAYHLEYLNRLFLLAFFDRLNNLDDFKYISEFNYKERQYLYKLCRIYLFETPASFPRQAVNSLKTVTDRATDIFNKFKEPIAEIIKKISKAKGVEVDLSKIELDKKIQMSHRDNFYNLRSLLERVGINTIYVLVDKVDEQSLTGNDPKASYTFISPLLKDLELLETPGVAFKFFLWDELRFYCSKDARPDRVFSFQLNWSVHQMKKMLNKRLSAYSSGYIIKAEQLFRDKKSYGRVIVFSEFSPRDCIRICNRILSEHIKENNGENVFGPGVVNRSIDMFCREKVQESIFNEGNLRHLAKVDAVSFTIEELVSKKVGADNPAVRNIINPWTKAELAKKIGLVKRLKKKAVNEYAFSDVRFARYACPTMDLDEFVKKKIRRCSEPACKKITYRDFDKKNYACPECNTILV